MIKCNIQSEAYASKGDERWHGINQQQNFKNQAKTWQIIPKSGHAVTTAKSFENDNAVQLA